MGGTISEREGSERSGRCGFSVDDLDNSIPDNVEIDCQRDVWQEAEDQRCVWHAEQPKVVEEAIAELRATASKGTLVGAWAPETDLRDVVADDAFPDKPVLFDANLSQANLSETDLTSANFAGAQLSDADFSGAQLSGADFSGSNLSLSKFSDAQLFLTNFLEADLRGADLRDANLGEIILSGVTLSRKTKIDDPGVRIRRNPSVLDKETIYDIVARTNHQLRVAYSENGLTGRARRARLRERRARRREALAEGGLQGTGAWFGSLLSRIFTGYGVQLRWVVGVMLALYLASTAVYYSEGMTLGYSLYYSIVTFTTSPPSPPPSGAGQIVAGIETFAGTTAIVFLGYVLGAREQV